MNNANCFTPTTIIKFKIYDYGQKKITLYKANNQLITMNRQNHSPHLELLGLEHLESGTVVSLVAHKREVANSKTQITK
jgi:hypothetical protein